MTWRLCMRLPAAIAAASVLVAGLACGSGATFGPSDAGAPESDTSSDAFDAAVPIVPRSCSAAGAWGIPLFATDRWLQPAAWAIDVAKDGTVVAVVAGAPPPAPCHSGPTVGEGPCALLTIAPSSDVLRERRFQCGINDSRGYRVFALSDDDRRVRGWRRQPRRALRCTDESP